MRFHRQGAKFRVWGDPASETSWRAIERFPVSASGLHTCLQTCKHLRPCSQNKHGGMCNPSCQKAEAGRSQRCQSWQGYIARPHLRKQPKKSTCSHCPLGFCLQGMRLGPKYSSVCSGTVLGALWKCATGQGVGECRPREPGHMTFVLRNSK